ncbi:hypothetical protein VPEG_00113 [Vibrio phage SIO-2]|uniref:hypothetical protein n=1 Tax=Vibrio phage SIO-2 TaxID=700512 RepID=UPI0002357C96|nr:hypothetical protein VPEG_00113 [Vibrio phage SIO-2]AET42263.1 hypothetical protein VPEG_00113 [Vibrio phage SIO-2]QKE60689.1 hypothetical protein vBVhaSVHB1_2 [Vibrio phage vB_VhaS-VHB1]
MATKDKFSKMFLRNGQAFHLTAVHDKTLVETTLVIKNVHGELLAKALVCRCHFFTFEIHKRGKIKRGKRVLRKISNKLDPLYYSTHVGAWLVDHHAPKLK